MKIGELNWYSMVQKPTEGLNPMKIRSDLKSVKGTVGGLSIV